MIRTVEALCFNLIANGSCDRRTACTGVATVAVCVYLALFTIPGWHNVALALLVAASSFVISIDKFKTSSRHVDWITLAVGAFLLSSVISALGSVDIARSLSLSTPFAPAMLLFWLSSTYLSGRELKDVYTVSVLVGLALAGYLLYTAVVHGASDDNPETWISMAGLPLFVVPNDITFFSILVPMALTIVAGGALPLMRVVAAVAVVLFFLDIVVYQSRCGLVAAVVGAMIGMPVNYRKRRLLSALLLLPLLVIVDGISGFPFMQKFSGQWGTRFPIWWSACEMFLDAPILGQGPRAFGRLYDIYVGADHANVLMPIWHLSVPWAHQLFLEVLAEQGLLGLTTLLALFGFAAQGLLRGRSINEQHERAFVVVPLMGSLAAFIAAALVELSFIRLWVVVLLFVLLGCIAAVSSATDSRPGVESEE